MSKKKKSFSTLNPGHRLTRKEATMPIAKDNAHVAAILSKGDVKRLDEIAEGQGRSRSSLIAHIIKQYLREKAGS
jgi:hypothetical protein